MIRFTLTLITTGILSLSTASAIDHQDDKTCGVGSATVPTPPVNPDELPVYHPEK